MKMSQLFFLACGLGMALAVQAADDLEPMPQSPQLLQEYCHEGVKPLAYPASAMGAHQDGKAAMTQERKRISLQLLREEDRGNPQKIYRQLNNGPVRTTIIHTADGDLKWIYACAGGSGECDNNNINILYNPRTGQAWGLHYQDVWARLVNENGPDHPTFLGHPDPAIQAHLKSFVCDS